MSKLNEFYHMPLLSPQTYNSYSYNSSIVHDSISSRQVFILEMLVISPHGSDGPEQLHLETFYQRSPFQTPKNI
jgi:hypothetical protein